MSLLHLPSAILLTTTSSVAVNALAVAIALPFLLTLPSVPQRRHRVKKRSWEPQALLPGNLVIAMRMIAQLTFGSVI